MYCKRTYETIKRQTYQKGQGTLRGTCEDTHPKNEKEA